MKHRILLASALVCGSLILSGCAAQVSPTIEDHTWTFQTAQTAANNGDILYCSAQMQAQCPEAEVLDLWLSADDGRLLISDNDKQSTWAMDYLPQEQNRETSLYSVTYAADNTETTGTAAVTFTTSSGEEDTPTLVIAIDEYALYFSAE